MANYPSREEIERRAYEIYEERGCEGGRELEDWLAAERELSQRSSAPQRKGAGVAGRQREVYAGSHSGN